MTAAATDTTQVLLALEEEARQAQTPEALEFTAVNESRRLLAYSQAVLLLRRGERRYRAVAAAGVPVLDRDAPFIPWMEKVAARIDAGEEARRPGPVAAMDLPRDLAADWHAFGAASVLWQPLVAPDGDFLGALWLAREAPWQEPEQVLADRLAGAYAHAWQALLHRGRRRRRSRPLRWRLIAAAMLLLAAAGLAWPVPQSALAPAEVAARNPLVVGASMEGVIESFAVTPEERVEKGQVLFTFEDMPLRNRLRLAEKKLAVARAELEQAGRGAFGRARDKEQVALLEARVALRAAERDHAREMLDRVRVRAQRAGVAVFSDAQEWVGKPVRVGERVMSVADPDRVEMSMDLAVGDGITLERGAPVRLFLDVRPLAPLDGVLTRAAYKARETPEGTMAYRVHARFTGTAAREPPRIGLQGTARILGPEVPLAWVLFRRPLSPVRHCLVF